MITFFGLYEGLSPQLASRTLFAPSAGIAGIRASARMSRTTRFISRDLATVCGRGDQSHVAAPDHQERGLTAVVGPVERGDGRMAECEELAVALGHGVGQAAAVALPGQGQSAADPVAVGLEHHLFLT